MTDFAIEIDRFMLDCAAKGLAVKTINLHIDDYLFATRKSNSHISTTQANRTLQEGLQMY